MTKVVYQIVEHDGGWAYKVGEVFSETFPTYDRAKGAAEAAARKQAISGATTGISYEDRDGTWHQEVADGSDRPETQVQG